MKPRFTAPEKRLISADQATSARLLPQLLAGEIEKPDFLWLLGKDDDVPKPRKTRSFYSLQRRYGGFDHAAR